MSGDVPRADVSRTNPLSPGGAAIASGQPPTVVMGR
jgi:hypothetical protein